MSIRGVFHLVFFLIARTSLTDTKTEIPLCCARSGFTCDLSATITYVNSLIAHNNVIYIFYSAFVRVTQYQLWNKYNFVHAIIEQVLTNRWVVAENRKVEMEKRFMLRTSSNVCQLSRKACGNGEEDFLCEFLSVQNQLQRTLSWKTSKSFGIFTSV